MFKPTYLLATATLLVYGSLTVSHAADKPFNIKPIIQPIENPVENIAPPTTVTQYFYACNCSFGDGLTFASQFDKSKPSKLGVSDYF